MCLWASTIAHTQQESILIAKVRSRWVRWFAVVISVPRFPWRRPENEGCPFFRLSPLLHLFTIAGTVAGLLLLLGSYRLQNSRVFFSKSVKKSVKRGVRVLRVRGVWGLKCEAKENLSPVSLSVFSLVADLLFDCSRVLEYAKIRTVLQSRGAMNGVHSASVILDYPTSGVPQNVDVVPEGSIPSLQRPKSVKTTWPCKKIDKCRKRIVLSSTKL